MTNKEYLQMRHQYVIRLQDLATRAYARARELYEQGEDCRHTQWCAESYADDAAFSLAIYHSEIKRYGGAK